jgi:pyruvate dehydrogenase E1 component alpha subunit
MNHKTKDQLIAFETKLKTAFEAGELPYLIHLSGGNEDNLIGIFDIINQGDWVLSTHRSHYHYLLAGGSEERLEQLVRAGKSMFVFDRGINFFTSSIVAGTACIAAGIAQSIKLDGGKNKVVCFLGDGAEDEGHFYEAVQWVNGQELPCLFVIEDNDRSVDTTKKQRRGHARTTWPPCVYTYNYVPTYPHAGTGCKQWVKFKNTQAPVW